MVDEQRRAYNREWNRRNREHVKAYRDRTREHRNARRRERYREDHEYREKAKAEARASARRRGPFERKALRAKQTFGLDPGLYEDLHDRGCAICGANPLVDPAVRMHVDHDHRTGKVRGLLCQSCNIAIGHIHDDPIVAAAALDYLLKGGVLADA